MPSIKFRSYHPNLVARRTRLEMPGWAGENQPRADGSHEQPWHCIPFSEYARGGLELCYPHESELRVVKAGGAFRFETAPPPEGEPAPLFRSFGAHYYSYTLLADLKVDPGLALKVEPHPRFFTDSTGTVPIAVPALIRHWWPMINFAIFKAPAEGQTHIFHPGEPFLQITVVNADDKPELIDMPEEEAAERELQSRRMHASRDTLGAASRWQSSNGIVFDGTYRFLAGAAKAKSK